MKKPILNHFKRLMSMMLTVILFLSTISFEVFAEDPKVSIIIPVYNTPQNLLRDCLESAKNQTLKDIEIICVDDGSTDGSGKILDEYAKSDPRFVVIHQENGGVSVARNNAMNSAKGEYIKFLDSDDMIDDIAAEKSYNVAKEYDADIVRYSIKKDIERGKYKFYQNLAIWNKFELIEKNSSINLLSDDKFKTKIPINVWAGLYKNKFLKDNNIKFFEKIKCICEDLFFNIICASRLNKIVFMPDQMYVHRNNPMSITSSSDAAIKIIKDLACGRRELHNFWESSGLLSESNMKTDLLNLIFKRLALK